MDRRLDDAEASGSGEIRVESCGEIRALSVEREESVCVEESWRLSRLTGAESGWTLALPSSSSRRSLEISFAALAAENVPTATHADTAWRLEVLDGQRVVAAASGEANRSRGWQVLEQEVPAGADRLRLASEGPVAWAEALLLGAGPSRPATGDAAADGRPNLILVILDTLRSDSLGLYGYGRETSPELEELSRDAWLFPHSLSVSTCTQPSTSSLLSGLAPHQHGVRAGLVLPEAAETFVEKLRQSGYRTAAITDGGFVAPNWGFAQGFDRYDATRGDSWVVKDAAPIIESTMEWLDQNRFEPFFLLVHTYETHMPYTDPEGFAADYLEAGYEGRYRDGGVIKLSELPELDDGDRRRLRDLYDGEVRRADHYVGRLIDRLQESGLYEESALLLTSDHGEEFFEFGGAEHGFGRVFDPHVRVPMLLKLPGEAGQGGRGSCPASGLDVAPTLLDLAGLAAPDDWLGRSLLTCQPGSAAGSSAGSPGSPVPRPILAHGLSAFPKNTELERFRLDRGTRSVIFDRQDGTLQAFSLDEDGAQQALLESFDEEALLAAQHLQAMLAWSGGAPFLIRLELGGGELFIPEHSRLDPIAVLDGFLRHEGERREGGTRFNLRTDGPVYLLTELGRGSNLEIFHDTGEGRRALAISTRTESGEKLEWKPLGETLPPPWVIFEGAPGLKAEERRMTAEEEAELRSLGYL